MSQSSIHLQPEADAVIGQVNSVYWERDFALLIEPVNGKRTTWHRISVATLTLLFDPQQHVFEGLDAYTNAARWQRSQLVLPKVDRHVALMCTEPFDEHGVGAGPSWEPHFIYSPANNLLYIRFTVQQVVTRARCLSSVVCGLSSEGDLAELWLERLLWEQ